MRNTAVRGRRTGNSSGAFGGEIFDERGAHVLRLDNNVVAVPATGECDQGHVVLVAFHFPDQGFDLGLLQPHSLRYSQHANALVVDAHQLLVHPIDQLLIAGHFVHLDQRVRILHYQLALPNGRVPALGRLSLHLHQLLCLLSSNSLQRWLLDGR